MVRVARALRPVADAVLWVQCTLMVRLGTEGWFWLIGRRARERAFVRRLLVAYPGLAEQPRDRLNRVADRALGPLARWPLQPTALGAMVIAGFIAKAAWSFLFALGAPLPPWTRPPLVAGAALCVGEAVRRAYVRRDVNRVVASFYPALFCTCGYCLVGLPDGVTRCPECGGARHVTVPEPPSRPVAPAAASAATG